MAKRPTIIPVRISILEVIIVCLISLCILLLVTNNVESFINVLYSPVAFLVLVVVLVEYIILKSADRSRLYKIELDYLRQRKIEQIKIFHQLERRLEEVVKVLHNLKTYTSEPEKQEELERLKNRMQQLKDQIHSLL